MEFYQVIERRRTVRDFKRQDVPRDVLARILDAGLKAPTYDHRREWEYVVLRERHEKDAALQFVREFVPAQTESYMVKPVPGTLPQKMYADAMPKQYSMLDESDCVILPFFKAPAGLLRSASFSSLNSLTAAWCCIENIFLAAAAEGLACSMRIPVSDEGDKVAKAVGAPDGYRLPCYIGLGYPAGNAVVLEQVPYTVEEKTHFGKW